MMNESEQSVVENMFLDPTRYILPISILNSYDLLFYLLDSGSRSVWVKDGIYQVVSDNEKDRYDFCWELCDRYI